jgi:hypothetical protein
MRAQRCSRRAWSKNRQTVNDERNIYVKPNAIQMVTRRSTSKTNRRSKPKRSSKRRPSRRSSSQVVVPMDYEAMTSTEPMMDDASSMPSMLGMVVLLLMLAGTVYAWYMVSQLMTTTQMAKTGSATSLQSITTNQNIMIGLAALLTLITLVTMYKVFM